MKRRDLVRHLQTHGCQLLREGARHSWHNPALNLPGAAPRHSGINDHLASKICQDLGIAKP